MNVGPLLFPSIDSECLDKDRRTSKVQSSPRSGLSGDEELTSTDQ